MASCRRGMLLTSTTSNNSILGTTHLLQESARHTLGLSGPSCRAFTVSKMLPSPPSFSYIYPEPHTFAYFTSHLLQSETGSTLPVQAVLWLGPSLLSSLRHRIATLLSQPTLPKQWHPSTPPSSSPSSSSSSPSPSPQPPPPSPGTQAAPPRTSPPAATPTTRPKAKPKATPPRTGRTSRAPRAPAAPAGGSPHSPTRTPATATTSAGPSPS